MTEVQKRFIAFVEAREDARLNRLNKNPRPWSTDPIVNTYKFCNVNREHDAVTRWIAENVRPKLVDGSLNEAIRQLVLCRVFNQPEALGAIMPVTNYPRTKKKLLKMKKSGAAIFRGAYIVVVHGKDKEGVNTSDYYLDRVREMKRMDFSRFHYLYEVAEMLSTVPGLGDFMVNQVCADLRYQSPWGKSWKDWGAFVLAGPGTRRGLNRYCHDAHDASQIKGNCQPLLLEIRDLLEGEVSTGVVKHFRDPNNLSNCFCEFDKYERVRSQIANNERTTIHKYHGIHST
jgi:hypothetical protein